MAHDLAKDVKAYRDKHMDELRMMQSQIRFDTLSRNGKPLDSGSKETVQPIVKIVLALVSIIGSDEFLKNYPITYLIHLSRGIDLRRVVGGVAFHSLNSLVSSIHPVKPVSE